MSNTVHIESPYFDTLRELMRHAEAIGSMECHAYPPHPEAQRSAYIYEREALQNFIGEARCVINEAEARIIWLENLLAEDV